MKHRFKELFKDLCIILLTLAIVLLVILALPLKTVTSTPWLATLLRPVAPLLGMSEAALTYTEPAEDQAFVGAARPIAISVLSPAGRSSAQYQAASLEAGYETYGSVLARAIESASGPTVTDQNEFLAAAQQPSVSFCYPATLPVKTIGAWLNVDTNLQTPGQWFCLSEQDDLVYLYVLGNAECIRYQTQISTADLTALLAQSTPDGSFFAFEDPTGKFASVHPISLICPQQTAQLYSAAAANPCDARFITNLATTLGFNPYGDARYVDDFGNTSFTETDCSLFVSAQGEVSLHISAADERFMAAANTPQDQIEAARALLANIAGDTLADASIYLVSYEQTDGDSICTFQYYLDAIAVSQESGYAAQVRFSGRSMTSASILLRTYTRSSASVSLLPPAQAAAIVSEGSVLQVMYADTGSQELQLNWKS